MVKDFSNTNYQVVLSKTEHPVPVFSNIPLHSLNHPIEEAKEFVKTQEKNLLQKNRILVLGLGFAYHLNAMIEILEKQFGKNFEIVVVEPSLALAQDCLTRNLINDERVTVFSKPDPSQLFQLEAFVDSLVKGATLITHPASFDVHQKYFKDFLSYRAGQAVGDFVGKIHSENLKENLKSKSTYLDLKKAMTKEDFLLKAFSEMVSS